MNAVAVLRPELKEAVERLWRWQKVPSGSFYSSLFELFIRADSTNFDKLSTAFPAEAMALQLWQRAASEGEFFRSYGLPY